MFFLTWICFFIGCPPESAYVSYMVTYILVNVTRWVMMKRLLGFPIMEYVKEVVVKVIFTVPFAIAIPYMVIRLMEPSFVRLMVICVVCTLSTAISICFLGLKRTERKTLVVQIQSKINKKKTK